MTVSVTFRHMEPTDALKGYASERVQKLSKLLQRPFDAHVVLSVERHQHIADVNINANGLQLRGEEKTGDMYASLDRAVEKIEKQVRRYKAKLTDRRTWAGRDEHPIKLDVIEVSHPPEAVEGQPAEETHAQPPPRVVKSTTLAAKAMSVNEAVMQMDLLNNNFLVFTNIDTREINVIYRRDAETYGVIEARKA